MNQKEILKTYLETHDGVSRATALFDLGIGNLPARISELRADGVRIMTVMVDAVNQRGQKIKYGIYRMVKK